MEYNVDLEEFQGPLDLLLDLIKKNNLDIFNIDLTFLTEQYLLKLNEMEKVNLNGSGEYLVIAAELINLKSKKLLPTHQIEDEEEQTFINRVLEYKIYRDLGEHFKELTDRRNQMFSKTISDMSCYKVENKLDEKIKIDVLYESFLNFLKRKEDEKPISARVVKKEYSVSKRMKEIKEILKKKKKIRFFDLFEEYHKPYIIVTFVTVLEMVKNGMIEIKGNKDEFYLLSKDGAK